ncbi:MAG: hypothetical protein ACNA7J_04865 [Wenzhouxiangella sp.]
MSPCRRRIACVLIVALMISGVPMNAAGAVELGALATQAGGQLDKIAEQAPRDCLLHASNPANYQQSDCDGSNCLVDFSGDCHGNCHDNCRCFCAGMSVMVHSLVQAGVAVPFADAPSLRVFALPSQPADNLLRPPQA